MKRHPAVAGSFYPADPQQLQQQVDAYLRHAAAGPAPKALIVPHAGYIYSGPVAASAYRRLASVAATIRRVVLIGPSHRVAFNGLALSQAEAFTTPLGDVTLDRESPSALADLPYVGYLEQAHSQEHSLEVHLPFLQRCLTDFRLLPLVAGNASPKQVATVLARVWGGPETLIVVSSDLSHYHDYETARRLDKQTSERIEKRAYQMLDPQAACGCVPISGLLALAEQQSLHIETIDLRNSGDTAGDKRRVVGYGAYVVN